MKKMSFLTRVLLLPPFLAGCASQNITERQPAADNSVLFTCQSNNFGVVKHFFSNSEPPASVTDGAVIKMTVGQDRTETSPLFEMRVDFLNTKGEQLAAPRTYKRLAFTQSESTGQISLTYSPTQTYRNQGARSFNMLVAESNAKLAFIQQNGSNAENRSLDLTCDRSGEAARLPKSPDLANMSDAQKVSVVQTLRRALPGDYHYAYGKQPLNPSFATIEVDMALKDIIAKTSLDEMKKRIMPGPNGKLTLLNTQCSKVAWMDYSDIRDFTGKIVAHRASITCPDPVMILDGKYTGGETFKRTYGLQYYGFYVINNKIYSDSNTAFDLNVL